MDVKPTLKRFERWLIEQGYPEACIDTYVGAVRTFLRVAKSANPTPEEAMAWHGDLAESKLSRSTVNIWGAGLKAFYRSRGFELTLRHLKVNNKIPYFFSEEEVLPAHRGCAINGIFRRSGKSDNLCSD